MKEKLQDMRSDYNQPQFDISQASKDPFEQFKTWFDEWLKVGREDANAMTLATSSKDGMPSARIVLLKGIEKGLFHFYTNYQSQKGIELAENPKVSLNFYWPELQRQVRISGVAQRLSEEESTSYFQSRPRDSQIGAWASPQSHPIKNREVLEKRVDELQEKFSSSEKIEKPKQWGGYGVEPFSIEFWQGRPSRLHDRLIYYKESDNSWKIRRLAP